jgi:YHS domain-containing protein
MTQVTDPVCGMRIDVGRAAAQEVHGDHVHHFCSAACARAFRQAPDRYASAQAEAEAEDMRRRTPPHMKRGGIVTPMFGSAGSGGAEYEPVPEDGDQARGGPEED